VQADPVSNPTPNKLIPRAGIAVGILLLVALGFAITTLLGKLWTTPDETVQIGGPFTLVEGGGKLVSDTDFRGKWMLVYFGYTHCPDACPTALSHIANALDELGTSTAAGIVPVFITVDPARDTPAVMHDYVSAFDSHIYGLSGSADQIANAEGEYRVYAAKHPEPDGDYSMDHSSIIYVMNPKGQFVTSFTQETTVDAMAAKLRQLGA